VQGTSLRLFWIASLIAMLLSVFPSEGVVSTAMAKNRGKAKISRSTAKKSSSKKKHRSRRRHKKYTLRGNPEVTRRVATQLIVEKLPELAALVDLQAPASQADATDTAPAVSNRPTEVSTKPAALTGTTPSGQNDSYQDSELDEREDEDGITAEDEEELEDMPDDINYFYREFTAYMASLNGESDVTYNGIDKQMLMETLVDWLGTRYLFGGITDKGIDCSAFTGMVYRSLNYKLPRTAAMQWGVGMSVDRNDLQFGDLIFFHTRQSVYVSHVGIYLGNNMFAHASSRNGVTVSSLEADYYNTHFIGARRYDFNSVTTASLSSAELSHQ